MTSEEKVLKDLEEKLAILCGKLAQIKVTEKERKDFEAERDKFQLRIDDYKNHKANLEKRIKEWNLQHP